MKQKKTLTELYQDCKRKQELKEFMARLDFINAIEGYLLCDGSIVNTTLDNIKENTTK
jgi:hypothetical protein